MSKLKKLILILSIIIVIVIGAVIYIFNKYKAQILYGVDVKTDDTIYEIKTELKRVDIRNNYYAVKTCINKFYAYYSSIYDVKGDYLIQDEEVKSSIAKKQNKSIDAVYKMLDEEYISYYGITTENLITHLKEIEEMTIHIRDMYVTQRDENIGVYFVNGQLINSSRTQSVDFSIIVKMDMLHHTFSILLDDYVKEKYADIKVGENIQISNIEKIENKEYNIFDYEIINDNTYVSDIFNSLWEDLIFNKQIAYEKLDEEYRNKRFPTINDFEKYVKDNIRQISVMELSSYQRNVTQEGIQYRCRDNNNKYYIINEHSIMNCTFILDTYTLDLPEFVEKYKTSDNETKVCLNIEKIREAINNKDFQYVYNKTDETFRNNKFKNYGEFENYLKSNLFEENIFEYKQVLQQANIYTAKVIIKNKKNNEEKTMTVMMKLTDTTDYYISFNFEK